MDPLGYVEKIVKAAMVIKKAVETVSQNKKDCDEIRTYADEACVVMNRLHEKTEMTKDPEMVGHLKVLAESFQEALNLVEECQQKPDVLHVVAAGDLSDRLQQVLNVIARKLRLVQWATSAYNTELLTVIKQKMDMLILIGLQQHADGAPNLLPQPQVAGVVEIVHGTQSTNDDRNFIGIMQELYKKQLNVAQDSGNDPASSGAKGGKTKKTMCCEGFIAFFLGNKVRKQKKLEKKQAQRNAQRTQTLQAPQNPQLVFVWKRGGAAWQHGFDLEDLQRASPVELGKGSLGISYMATVEKETTVVVKLLCNVTASREVFTACVEAAGDVEHLNLAPVRGYFYSKDEYLLVGDYFPTGSLSARLHGSRGTDARTPMDWDARLCAALCAARGVAHLHTVQGLAHGNIKSSNLLLRTDPDAAALSDYCLNQLFDPAPAGPNVGGGYRAPELVDARYPTFKSDVYSLGVLFLELLTGQSPDSDDETLCLGLPLWVKAVMTEQWIPEVWDAELKQRLGWEAEQGMLKLLLLAIKCVATVPGERPDADDVVKRIEEIREEHGRTTTEETRGVGGEAAVEGHDAVISLL